MSQTISSNVTGPVVLGLADNPLTITGTGTVTSTGTGLDGIDGEAGTTWTITNAGKVTSSGGNCVSLAGMGIIGNDIEGGGSVTNATGASLTGTAFGVFITGGSGVVANNGTIGGDRGVNLAAGGSVTNAAGASIWGNSAAVFSNLGSTTLINAGTISATGAVGLDIEQGGNVANLGGASISGSTYGVFIRGGGSTVVTGGTISGGAYAVDFLNSGDRSVVNPGAVFHGKVVGGLASNVVLTGATERVALPSNTTIATFAGSMSDQAGGFTATINWGDGATTPGVVTGSNGSFTVSGGHTYAYEASVPMTATIIRTADNTVITGSGNVTVAEHDALSAQGTTVTGKPGQALTNVTMATFTDTDKANVASDFTATIDWGDGTTTLGTVGGANGAFTVSGTHTYPTAGNDTVTVTIADDAPGTATVTAIGTTLVAADLSFVVIGDFDANGRSDIA